MGMFDSYAPSNANSRFLEALEKLADAAKTAADAYAKKAEQPIVTVNINRDDTISVDHIVSEVTNAIKRHGRVQDR